MTALLRRFARWLAACALDLVERDAGICPRCHARHIWAAPDGKQAATCEDHAALLEMVSAARSGK